MESQPQNPEFRINPENFHPCGFTKSPHAYVQSFMADTATLKIILTSQI